MKTIFKQFSKTLLTGVLGLTAYPFLSGGSKLWAGTEPGYSHDGGVQVYHQAWMSHVPSNFKLSYLSLPGTHDTMSRIGGDAVQTQSMDLQNQLDAGIRVLDIRIGFGGNSFGLSHNFVPQSGMFDNVLDTVINFLKSHPSETVLMRVKYEFDFGLNTRTFEQVFLDYWNGSRSPYFWRGTNHNPPMAEIRGTIVVLQDFKANGSYGIPYSSFVTQDDYNLKDNWDLYRKWTEVENQLTLSHDIGLVMGWVNTPLGFVHGAVYDAPTSHSIVTPSGNINFQDALEDVRFMNYLSGATGSFPYFVASGKSSPATDAPRLATGKTTPGWSDWPDFPRVDCFIGICTIAFEGTNNLTNIWLEGNNPKRVGIIMADFPGPGLIQSIINANYHLAQTGF